MNTKALEVEATSMSEKELKDALGWHAALAEHYDDNMDYSGYHAANDKVQIIKAELRRRGIR